MFCLNKVNEANVVIVATEDGREEFFGNSKHIFATQLLLMNRYVRCMQDGSFLLS